MPATIGADEEPAEPDEVAAAQAGIGRVMAITGRFWHSSRTLTRRTRVTRDLIGEAGQSSSSAAVLVEGESECNLSACEN